MNLHSSSSEKKKERQTGRKDSTRITSTLTPQENHNPVSQTHIQESSTEHQQCTGRLWLQTVGVALVYSEACAPSHISPPPPRPAHYFMLKAILFILLVCLFLNRVLCIGIGFELVV